MNHGSTDLGRHVGKRANERPRINANGALLLLLPGCRRKR
jgi:hypothetical protein